MERLLVDATEEDFLNASPTTQDDIIESTIKIIRDSNFISKGELSYDYPGGTIDYNFQEAADNYESNMNQLRNSK